MTLVIKRTKRWRTKQFGVAVWVVGAMALVVAPFTQALSVRSPDAKSHKAAQQVAVGSSHNARGTAATLGASTASSNSATSSDAVAALSDASTDCRSPLASQNGLLTAASSQLRKLAQYNKVCSGSVVTTVSFFTPIPTTDAAARSNAADVIAQLKEFSAHGIRALVFFEPTTDQGLIDMNTYAAGAYDSALDTYFATIKSSGVTDAMMGTWVPFPEGNIPVWTSVDPNVFTNSVIRTVNLQKKYFPTSQASIMLDSMTYPSASSWSNGTYSSLLPYVQNMPAGLLDSMGLQGFPWSPPANHQDWGTNGEPQSYLRVDLAAQAARSLNVNSVWLNTGTFRVSYAGKAGQQVDIAPARRQQLLFETVDQAKVLQRQGFQVSVHLFAQDKSAVAEGIDWSYWPTNQASASPSTAVLQSFVHALQVQSIQLWLFDTDS